MYSHFKLLYNNGLEPELLTHDLLMKILITGATGFFGLQVA